MSKLLEGSSIHYLNLSEVKEVHSIWKEVDWEKPYDAISPEDLVSLMGDYKDDSWIEWLLVSHPIVVSEKMTKASGAIKSVGYYRIIGHGIWNFLVRYIGAKYGPEGLEKRTFPVLVLPLKKLGRYKNQILSTELVYSFLFQKSKHHRAVMQDYLFSAEEYPIPYLKSLGTLSKFARVSKGTLEPKPKKHSPESLASDESES